jgi:hypothetical protein
MFLPALFDPGKHQRSFPLEGPHLAVSCGACHLVDDKTDVRVFAGTARNCKGCHDNPHGAQFNVDLVRGDCSVCHGATPTTFAISKFDHRKAADYSLEGAHARARCDDCHLESTSIGEGSVAKATRVYRGTSRSCSSCHQDAHRGQFAKNGRTTCEDCHVSKIDWTPDAFDHEKQSRFRLDGEHMGVSCDACHLPVSLPDGTEMIQFKPMDPKCESCHEVSRR